MAAKGARQPELAAQVANAAYRLCMKAGGTDKRCAGPAIRKGLTASNNPLKGKD